MQTKLFGWKSFYIISWMTLSPDLVNKCSLSSSCVPSARITHNPGTQVDHNEARRQKCELLTQSEKCSNEGGRRCYLRALRGVVGLRGWHYFFLGRQEGFTKEAA